VCVCVCVYGCVGVRVVGVWVYVWVVCVQCYQQYRSAYLLLHCVYGWLYGWLMCVCVCGCMGVWVVCVCVGVRVVGVWVCGCMGVWGGVCVCGWCVCQCYQQYRSAYLLLHGLLQQTDHADDKKLLTKCKLSLSVVLRSMHLALA